MQIEVVANVIQPSKQTPFSSVWTWIKGHRVAIVAVCFWMMIILAVRQYMQVNTLTFSDLTEQLSVLLRESWFGPLLYIAVYLARPLILFPAFLLTLLGGSVFGIWPGFLYVTFAGTASAIFPYVIGRWFSSDQRQSIEKTSSVQRFVRMLQSNPFQAVLIMRLLYLPYDVVSLAVGSLRIPFVAFILATAVGNIGGTLSFLGIGSSLEGDLTTGDLTFNPAMLAFSVVILVVSLVISRVLNRYQQAQAATAPSEDNNE